MSRARGWCFTLNNPTDEEEGFLQDINPQTYRYIVVAHEKGENGTEHLQGYVLFKTMKSMAQVKVFLNTDRVHLETQRGTSFQAMMYCKKGEQPHTEWETLKNQGPNFGKNADFWENGEVPQDCKEQGNKEKERWKRARECAESGQFEEIDDDIYIRYLGNLRKIHQMAQKMPDPINTLDFWWFVGPSGSGKSRAARDENPGFYIKNINKWWDGYTNQPCVVIEEWSPDNELYYAPFLKTWCDHYAFAGETKGGVINIRPPKIIVTSNWTLAECFRDDNNRLPLQRRFKTRVFGPQAPVVPLAIAPNFIPPPQIQILAPNSDDEGVDDTQPQ